MIEKYLSPGRRSLLIVALAGISLLSSGSVHARQAPLLETRGVWFATVLRDGGWPRFPTDPAAVQEADLRSRIREAWSLGLNTFVFQAVARGDAMYPSTRLPWSVRLGGAGVDPGYDPLAVAVDECHRLGMELHAWINTYRVGDVSTVEAFENVTNPSHVYYEHPGWVATHNGELWLDPSSADARAWLVANVLEIVDGYDIDAVHFDFIRYPTGGLSDDLASFQFDPRGFSLIEDWRRDNITQFVNDVSAAVLTAKPWVKVGSAPFGNYASFSGAWPAAWAYSDVFQESRKWLTDGTHDYVAPQIYFDIGREPEPPNAYDSPDFAWLVDDWVANSANRPIFAGHGPYKSVVFEELDAQVARSRSGGAGGQVFFRFDHIRSFDFSTSYPTRALPFPMTHRFEFAAPTRPVGPTSSTQSVAADSSRITLNWQTSVGSTADPLRGYAVFGSINRDPVPSAAEDLLGYVAEGDVQFSETVANAEAADRRYTIVALSRLGARSDPSDVVRVTATNRDEHELPATAALEITALEITALWPQPGRDLISVQIAAADDSEVLASIVDVTGRVVRSRYLSVRSGRATTEFFDVSSLASGAYVLIVRSEAGMHTRRIIVTH